MTRIIHLDLDGVLADFNHGVKLATGRRADELPADDLWSRIAAIPDFFLRLEVAESGKLLFETAQSLGEVRILAEMPRKSGCRFAEQEKRSWIAKHFGPDVLFVAVQYALEKAEHARPGDILIDDSAKNISRWVEAGGIGIVHSDVDITVAELMKTCAGCAPRKFSSRAEFSPAAALPTAIASRNPLLFSV